MELKYLLFKPFNLLVAVMLLLTVSQRVFCSCCTIEKHYLPECWTVWRNMKFVINVRKDESVAQSCYTVQRCHWQQTDFPSRQNMWKFHTIGFNNKDVMDQMIKENTPYLSYYTIVDIHKKFTEYWRYRTGWSTRNALCLYSWTVRFESRPGHRLFFVFFLSSSRKCRQHLPSASFQILPHTSFISHPTTQCFSLDTECVVKSLLKTPMLLAEFERAENASRTANSNRTVLFTHVIIQVVN